MSEKRFVNPPGLKPLGMYSNVACARGGTLVFISGQVATGAEDDLGQGRYGSAGRACSRI